MKNSLLTTLILIAFNLALFGQNSNNALHFNSQSNDYVNINNIAQDVANLNSFTIEFWVKYDAQENQDHNVFYSANSSDQGNRMIVRTSGSFDGVQSKLVVFLKGSSEIFIVAQRTIGDNRCHHIAFTYENQACSLYVDGELDATANHNFKFQPSDIHSLGQEFDKPPYNASQFYKGELDDFRIWNYAKTQTEIQNNKDHELTGNEIGLLEYFDFNQGVANGNNTSISTLENKANPANNGTLMNFALNGSTSNFTDGKCRIATAGIESNEVLNQIIVSPNPTSGIINISNSNSLSSIHIKNSLGQTVLQPKPSSVINISSLPKACYFMKITGKNGTSKTIKIIKQ